jgi:ring-1,2-phenylacetyl-CoA epoxidase subunit PaaD
VTLASVVPGSGCTSAEGLDPDPVRSSWPGAAPKALFAPVLPVASSSEPVPCGPHETPEQHAWRVLATVLDPEVPVLSVCDLGIVREVQCSELGTQVVLTPTYSGCPATEAIQISVVAALVAAGLGPVAVTHRLAPAWTTDWITADGREKLRAYGIAPPSGHEAVGGKGLAVPISIRPRNLKCPRCGSADTERLAAFGSTACKALHRCRACLEPFEYFKPL